MSDVLIEIKEMKNNPHNTRFNKKIIDMFYVEMSLYITRNALARLCFCDFENLSFIKIPICLIKF